MVTTTKDMDAEEAPEFTEEQLAEAAALRTSVPPAEKVNDQARHKNKMMTMKGILDAQPKVKVRVRKEIGPQSVIINGVQYNLPAGIPVNVPEQVAQMLIDGEII